MLPDRDVTRLWHMLEAARHVLGFAEGRKETDLNQDLQFGFAIERGLEIIGEAAAQASKETRAQLPRLEWPKIVGLRNRMAHVYFSIDAEVIWETVTRDLPTLITVLEEALKDYPTPPGVWDPA
ncbi:MAG: DUF86 domain-containing protein [Armatimonadetes bacterium]|nr:DUF86 domain-containing protein [Armatimonadota bacterium]